MDILTTPRDRTIAEMAAIAERHGLSLDEALKGKRHKHSHARKEIAYFLVVERGKSLQQAAKAMGLCDHTAVYQLIGRYRMLIGHEDHPSARAAARKMAYCAAYRRQRRRHVH